MTEPHLQRSTTTAASLEHALFEVKRVVVGQDQLVERMLVGLLARGHCLLEGVPGVAKTLAVRTLAEVIGDIMGTRIWRPSAEGFDTELGPVFANLVLADEINRAPAKVQSALLEAMQERQVTIGRETYALPDPFLVMATQNPIESEGTYPLPEAQVDRFMLKVLVGYPERDEELTVVQRSLTLPPELRQALPLDDLRTLQRGVLDVYVDPG